MAQIFISYRRDDSTGVAAGLGVWRQWRLPSHTISFVVSYVGGTVPTDA